MKKIGKDDLFPQKSKYKDSFLTLLTRFIDG